MGNTLRRMKDPQGRKAMTVSISMQPEIYDWVQKRIEGLGILVANDSHYFRFLIESDRIGHLIPPLDKGPRPPMKTSI